MGEKFKLVVHATNSHLKEFDEVLKRSVMDENKLITLPYFKGLQDITLNKTYNKTYSDKYPKANVYVGETKVGYNIKKVFIEDSKDEEKEGIFLEELALHCPHLRLIVDIVSISDDCTETYYITMSEHGVFHFLGTIELYPFGDNKLSEDVLFRLTSTYDFYFLSKKIKEDWVKYFTDCIISNKKPPNELIQYLPGWLVYKDVSNRKSIELLIIEELESYERSKSK